VPTYPIDLSAGGEYLRWLPAPIGPNGQAFWGNTAGNAVCFGWLYSEDYSEQRLVASVSTDGGVTWTEVDAANRPARGVSNDANGWQPRYTAACLHPTDSTRVCLIYNTVANTSAPEVYVQEFDLDDLTWGLEYGGASFPALTGGRVYGAVSRPLNGDVVLAFSWVPGGGDTYSTYMVTITPGVGAIWGAALDLFPVIPVNEYRVSEDITTEGWTGSYIPTMAVTTTGLVYLVVTSMSSTMEVYQAILATDDTFTTALIYTDPDVGEDRMLHYLSMGLGLTSSGSQVFLFGGRNNYNIDTSLDQTFDVLAGYCDDGGDLSFNLTTLTPPAGTGYSVPAAWYVNGIVWVFMGWLTDLAEGASYVQYTGDPPTAGVVTDAVTVFPAIPERLEVFLRFNGFYAAYESRNYLYWHGVTASTTSANYATFGKSRSALRRFTDSGYTSFG
jgi:hypothetical protein